MKRLTNLSFSVALLALSAVSCAQNHLTDYVNPFLGTATLWEEEDLGYQRTWETRTWGAEVFPGSSLPNAMVQVSPVTMYRSGAGYQYEDSLILGFSHTNKGHWNLLHVPLLPVNTEKVNPYDFASSYSHDDESACPGYYQVYLQRYGIDVELTSTLRCAYHRYTFEEGGPQRLLADLTRANNRVYSCDITRCDDHSFSGHQFASDGRVYFYAESDAKVADIDTVGRRGRKVYMVDFETDDPVLELKIGFSFVSVENAKENLRHEVGHASFDKVRKDALDVWEDLLSHIEVKGGTEREKGLFYSCLYRSFLWPALRSDVNGDYTDSRGEVANNGFRYYTNPSFWDDYRNKLVLLGMITPDVAADVIKSIIDNGEKRGGYMPTFFHGDHASTFISGSWLRGIRDFDLSRAYKLLLNNAFVPGRGGRPYLDEYLERGWIAEKDTVNVPTWDEYKAAVTKTVEYAYDDYATALVAKELGDMANYDILMKRSDNYKTLFDPSTGFWRGKIEDGSWIKDFDPYYPYFAYMYREANAWNSLFFAPHDPEGMIDLYPSHEAVGAKLDSLFTEKWRGYEVHNMTGFIGNYCHGNQPGHSIPYTYYFIDRQEDAQVQLDSIMTRFYDMGKEGLAYAGMDDAGEMSSWYVFNAMGLYTYSPADPEYIVSVPLFDRVDFTLGDGRKFAVLRKDLSDSRGRSIVSVRCGDEILDGWFVNHDKLLEAGNLTIETK